MLSKNPGSRKNVLRYEIAIRRCFCDHHTRKNKGLEQEKKRGIIALLLDLFLVFCTGGEYAAYCDSFSKEDKDYSLTVSYRGEQTVLLTYDDIVRLKVLHND